MGFVIVWATIAVPTSRAELAAARGLLLDACLVENVVLAVGEHGALIRSDDFGKSWTQIRIPFSGTFTGIAFGNTHYGWVIGHDSRVLATNDGGGTWAEQPLPKAEVALLSLYAQDARACAAVGAFGAFYTTVDAGRSWNERKVLDEDLHLNSVSHGQGTTFFVAGERGTLLRFHDLRATPVVLHTGYEGSMNGVLLLNDKALLAYGLRGHAFRSTDEGITWTASVGLPPVLLSTALQLKSGTVILAGEARCFFVSNDGGKTFSAWDPGLNTAVAKMVEMPDGTVLAFGEAGVSRLPAPEPKEEKPR